MASRLAEGTKLPYLAGLDGLRGLAIAAVLAYHLDRSWLPGGMLGITVFFTLSGFLITSLILREVDQTGRLDLRAFWLRRARRLVPAALATVALIALLAKLAGNVVGRDLIGDAVAAVTWTANWRFVTAGTTYAEVFEDPSPFQHFWSLAVEEQLYVALPLLGVVLLAGGRRRWLFAVVLLGGVAASTMAGYALYEPGQPPSRAYYGTDVRIAEPLVGALLALLLVPARGLRRLSAAGTHVVGVAGAIALAVVVWLMWTLSTADAALHRGGFLLTALASAVVVAAITQATPLARVISFPPLVALGRISYGVYLFHWPLFLYLEDQLRESGRTTVIAAQLSCTIALAAISYAVLELPIRLRQRDAGVFAVGWANASVAVVGALALSVTTLSAHASEPVDLGATADDAAPPPPAVEVTQPPAGTLPRAFAQSAPRQQAAAAVNAPQQAQPVDVADDPIVGGNDGRDRGPSAPPTYGGSELRVAVIGDSLGHNVAVGLTNWGRSRGGVVVYNLAISACPVSRGGERRFDEYEVFPVNRNCSWWDQPWTDRAQNLATFDPDVVVVEASLNELLDRRLPEWEDWRRPGQPAYHQWLLEEYNDFFAALRGMAGEETEFLVLNAVCADFHRHDRWRRVKDTNDRVRSLNQFVFPLMVEATQGDLFREVCPNGQYSEDLWGVENARPDGIHLSDEAATELAWRWLGPLVLDVAEDDDGSIIGASPGARTP